MPKEKLQTQPKWRERLLTQQKLTKGLRMQQELKGRRPTRPKPENRQQAPRKRGTKQRLA